MKVEGEYTFDAPRDAVWEALRDPEVLAAVMPGCEKLELVGEEAYEGALKIKVGPVQGAFKGKVKLEDLQPPEGYTMQLDGRGAPGFVRATARVRLEAEGEQTRMTYDSDAKVGGRIAGVGQRLLDSSSKAIIKQSLEGLNDVMKQRQAAVATADEGDDREEAPAPIVAPAEGPSQMKFAAGVAREMAKDLVPKPVWIIALVVLLFALLYRIFR